MYGVSVFVLGGAAFFVAVLQNEHMQWMLRAVAAANISV